MAAREQGSLRTHSPWPMIGWGTAAGIIIVAGVLGFGFLDRYQQGGPTLSLWNAICHGLGITADTGLSLQDSADVAAYFATQRGGLPTLTGNRVPEPGRSLRESDPAKRLIFAGDPERGIPPCSACHGPGGYKLGAPALQGQQPNYIDEQLIAFAQGMRQNDIFEQMRIIARGLTPDEMHAVAVFYGVRAGEPRAGGLALR